MKITEILLEKAIGTLTIGNITIKVDDHAMDQSIDRMVLPTDVDRVLKKFSTVKDQLTHIESGQKFWIYDPQLEVGLGCRMINPESLKIQFKTVIGPNQGAPYNGSIPVLTV